MKRFRFWLIGGLFVLGAPLGAMEPSTPTVTAARLLTLSESLTLALKGATDILKAQHRYEFTGEQLWQAYAQFLPNLQAGGQASWARGQEYVAQTIPATVNTRSREASYALTSTINLFNGFADTANLRSGRRENDAASLTLYRAKQEIVLDVTQAYLQVLLDRALVRFEEANVEASQNREELISAQTEVGSKSLADLYRQQAQTSADQLALIQARNRALNDLLFLLRRLRVDVTQEYDVADVALDTAPVASSLTDIQALMQEAVHDRADLSALRATADSAQSQITVARSGYWPRLNLLGGIGANAIRLDHQIVNGVDVTPAVQPTTLDQLHHNTLYQADLSAQWDLFNRWTTRAAVARAQEDSRDAEVDFDDLRQRVQADVKQAVNDYQAALQQVDAAARGVKAAGQSYEAAQERYKVGASNMVDLLTAQSALLQAQSSDAQARIGVVLAKETLDNVLGRKVTGVN